MDGIHVLHDEEKRFQDILRAIESAYPSTELFAIILCYHGDIQNMEVATGLSGIHNRIAERLPLSWREINLMASEEYYDPQNVSFLVSTSEQFAKEYKDIGNRALADIIVDCVDHDFWTIISADKVKVAEIASCFKNPQNVNPSIVERLTGIAPSK